MEVGTHISALRLGDFSGVSAGVGARWAYHLSSWASIDTEFDFIPHDSARVIGRPPGSPTYSVTYERRRAEALFGVKVGWRGDRVGIFGKARPGLTRLGHKGVGCDGDVCALVLLPQPVYRTEFAADVGGVLEVYPAERTVLRLDIGDLIIRQRGDAPPCRACVTHNLSSRVGIGWRF
jgi:hypothetical protein